MSKLFGQPISQGFAKTLDQVAAPTIKKAVEKVLARQGTLEQIAATAERAVEQFSHDELGVPRELRYADEFAFFDDYLRLAYETGGMSQGRGWCSNWWQHRSARFRVRSMWQAYEALAVKDPATCDEVFLRTIGDHHMGLLMGERSPMYACQTVHQPSKPLESTPIEKEAA
jgi:hypothetical protein